MNPRGDDWDSSWVQSIKNEQFAECVRDHQYFEEHKTEYRGWKLKRMGEKALNPLMLRAHVPGKRDDTVILMWLKQEMKK